MERVPTGNSFLDDCLGGGLPKGASLLVEGSSGAGSVEFVMAVLRAAIKSGASKRACYATALRSQPRVQREYDEIFNEGAKVPLDIRALRPKHGMDDCGLALADLGPGDVMAIETVAALSRNVGRDKFLGYVQYLADVAHESDVTLLLLHTPGTITDEEQAVVAEAVDGVAHFDWRSAGPTRRRILTVEKIRGLAPILDGEEVPIFEVSLHTGAGFNVSRVKSVV